MKGKSGNIKLMDILKESEARTKTGWQGAVQMNVKDFMKEVKKFTQYGKSIYRESSLQEMSKGIKKIIDTAEHVTLDETKDWMDKLTVSRDMKQIKDSYKLFEKTAYEMNNMQQRLESLYEEIGMKLNRYYQLDEEIMEEALTDLKESIIKEAPKPKAADEEEENQEDGETKTPDSEEGDDAAGDDTGNEEDQEDSEEESDETEGEDGSEEDEVKHEIPIKFSIKNVKQYNDKTIEYPTDEGNVIRITSTGLDVQLPNGECIVVNLEDVIDLEPDSDELDPQTDEAPEAGDDEKGSSDKLAEIYKKLQKKPIKEFTVNKLQSRTELQNLKEKKKKKIKELAITKHAQSNIKSSGSIPKEAVHAIHRYIQMHQGDSGNSVASGIKHLLDIKNVKVDRCTPADNSHIRVVYKGSEYNFRHTR